MNNAVFYEKLGSIIRVKRKAKKISGEKMGKYLGINKSSYSYYERGKTKISIDDLMKICHYLDLNWVEIIEEAQK